MLTGEAAQAKFEEIITKAIRTAQAVSCPFEDYVLGLEAMREELEETLDGAREELEAMRKGEQEDDHGGA